MYGQPQYAQQPQYGMPQPVQPVYTQPQYGQPVYNAPAPVMVSAAVAQPAPLQAQGAGWSQRYTSLPPAQKKKAMGICGCICTIVIIVVVVVILVAGAQIACQLSCGITPSYAREDRGMAMEPEVQHVLHFSLWRGVINWNVYNNATAGLTGYQMYMNMKDRSAHVNDTQPKVNLTAEVKTLTLPNRQSASALEWAYVTNGTGTNDACYCRATEINVTAANYIDYYPISLWIEHKEDAVVVGPLLDYPTWKYTYENIWIQNSVGEVRVMTDSFLLAEKELELSQNMMASTMTAGIIQRSNIIIEAGSWIAGNYTMLKSEATRGDILIDGQVFGNMIHVNPGMPGVDVRGDGTLGRKGEFHLISDSMFRLQCMAATLAARRTFPAGETCNLYDEMGYMYINIPSGGTFGASNTSRELTVKGNIGLLHISSLGVTTSGKPTAEFNVDCSQLMNRNIRLAVVKSGGNYANIKITNGAGTSHQMTGPEYICGTGTPSAQVETTCQQWKFNNDGDALRNTPSTTFTNTDHCLNVELGTTMDSNYNAVQIHVIDLP